MSSGSGIFWTRGPRTHRADGPMAQEHLIDRESICSHRCQQGPVGNSKE